MLYNFFGTKAWIYVLVVYLTLAAMCVAGAWLVKQIVRVTAIGIARAVRALPARSLILANR